MSAYKFQYYFLKEYFCGRHTYLFPLRVNAALFCYRVPAFGVSMYLCLYAHMGVCLGVWQLKTNLLIYLAIHPVYQIFRKCWETEPKRSLLLKRLPT